MNWINEWSKSIYNAFKNMVPGSWGPVDGLTLFESLNQSFILKLHKTITELKNKNIPIEKVAETFSNPSTLRGAILFLALENKYNTDNKKEAKEVFEYLVEVLQSMTKEDTFVYKSNICHSKEEINNILKETSWNDANPQIARELGKLYNSSSALSYSLYRDFFPQESVEVYGPYDASKNFGKNAILVIKHFNKMNPVELWPNFKNRHRDIKIMQIYKDVSLSCEMIGMHSIYKGDMMNGLVSFALIVDGKLVDDVGEIKSLSTYLAEIATEQSRVYEKMSKKELIMKMLEWECYQFFKFFKLAGIDWKPTKEMIKYAFSKDISDKSIIETFPSFKEYCESKDFELYWLKDLYK